MAKKQVKAKKAAPKPKPASKPKPKPAVKSKPVVKAKPAAVKAKAKAKAKAKPAPKPAAKSAKSTSKKPSVKPTSTKKPVAAKPKPTPLSKAKPAAAPVAPKAKTAKPVPVPAKGAKGKAAPAPAPAESPAGPLLPQPSGIYNGIRLTDQVKPFPTKTPYSKKEIDTLRDFMRTEREQLLKQLASVDSTNREVMDLSKEHPGYSLHLAEHATDLQTAEASLEVRSIVRERLEQFANALRRLDENPAHFGLCVSCGDKIGIQRLTARPQARLCMDCRTQYERIRSRRGLTS